MTVERSVIEGGPAYGSFPHVVPAPDLHGGYGIFAPLGVVTVLDSVVSGGVGPSYINFWDTTFQEPCAPVEYGPAGVGVVAGLILSSNSTISGGLGGTATCDGQELLSFEAAPAVLGTLKTLTNDLSASGPIVNGASWTLNWSPSDAIVLIGPLSPPLPIAGQYLFASPVPIVIAVPTSSFSTIVDVRPELVGTVVGVQAVFSGTVLSRPVVSAILP